MGRTKIRVGVIGTGRIASMVHLPSLKLCSEICEVVAAPHMSRVRTWAGSPSAGGSSSV